MTAEFFVKYVFQNTTLNKHDHCSVVIIYIVIRNSIHFECKLMDSLTSAFCLSILLAERMQFLMSAGYL